jgi:hypothetical protein
VLRYTIPKLELPIAEKPNFSLGSSGIKARYPIYPFYPKLIGPSSISLAQCPKPTTYNVAHLIHPIVVTKFSSR